MGALSDYYLSHPPNAEQTQKMLTQIKKVSDDSAKYIGGFSKLNQPLTLTFGPISLGPWLKARVAAHPCSHTPGIQLSLALPPEPSDITADAALLSDAVGVFLDNALDAMPAGGALSISCRLDKDNADIAVRNTGEPVSLSILSELGKPFMTMKTGRVGLGLGWAKRAAQAHGGDFTAANMPDGVEFTLRIQRRPGGR